MADRDLIIRIIGDDASYQRALARSAGSTRQMQANVSGLGASLTRSFIGATVGILTVREAFDQLGTAISNASNLNEQISKSRQIFGESSDAIEDWSKTTAGAMGISQAAALEATGVFGNLFRVVDVAPEQASAMSQALVQLAADLASFNNASPDDVLTALRSGLVGEAEPLRRYGILLSEARVQQQALATTGKATVASLTAQEKALARYDLILKDSALAQGDFARTQDGLANQSRILRANFDNLSASIGRGLTPAVTGLAAGLNDIFEDFGGRNEIDISVVGAENAKEFIEGLRVVMERLGDDANDTKAEIQGVIDLILQAQSAANIAPNEEISRGPGSGELSDEEKRNVRQRQAQLRLEESRKQFAKFVKGLGLKLDTAGLTASLNDDLAVLREIERAIQRQIASEGRTFKLAEQLVQVRLRISSVLEQQAAASAAASRRAIDSARDARRLREEEREAQREAALAARNAEQFQRLGLTAGGDERTPSTGTLARRANTLEDRIKGTVLDTAKTRQQLNRIQRVLSGDFGKVGRDVRQAILKMLDDIASALNNGRGTGDVAGPLTKTTGLDTKKILEGMGLSAEEINELRGRLSSVSTSRQFASSGAPRTFSDEVRRDRAGRDRFVVESHTTINLDGQQVAKVVTKQQQKNRRRNPQQKRGPNRAGRG